jgi:GTPase
MPHPEVQVDAIVPFTRGDLVARVHSEGEVLEERHLPEGTHLRARVRADLGAALSEFATPPVPA